MATWKRNACFSDSRKMSCVMMILIVTDLRKYSLYGQYAHQTEATVPLCYVKARREKVLFVNFCVPQTMLFLCHLKTGPVMKHLWTAFAHSLAYAPCVSVVTTVQDRMPSWFQNYTEQEEIKSHSHEHRLCFQLAVKVRIHEGCGWWRQKYTPKSFLISSNMRLESDTKPTI